jgi:hypothetical protein
MKISAKVKPALWGAVGGAAALTIVGFGGLGWTTASKSEKLAQTRVTASVADALAPFCVAKAELDPDKSKLAKFQAESSWWMGEQMVRDAGWATLSGATTPNSALADACAAKLRAAKAS